MLARGTKRSDGGDDGTPRFAKERTATQIEQDRAKRLGKEARAAGIWEPNSALQALYVFIDEPDSSLAARAFSVVIVIAIAVSSVLFVAETHSYVRTASCPAHLYSWGGSIFTARSCLAVQGRPELSAGFLRRDADASAPEQVRRSVRLRVQARIMWCSCGRHLW